MSKKESKDNISKNLLTIRKEFGYTQEKMAEFLEISVRSYGNYERGDKPFPIEYALKLAIKKKCSLDWIYGVRKPSYMVDIRKFLSCENDTILLSIPDSFWDYLHQIKNTAKHSDASLQDKEIEFDSDKYIRDTQFYDVEIPIKEQDFGIYIKNGERKLHVQNLKEEPQPEVTDEEAVEVSDFLKKYINLFQSKIED